MLEEHTGEQMRIQGRTASLAFGEGSLRTMCALLLLLAALTFPSCRAPWDATTIPPAHPVEDMLAHYLPLLDFAPDDPAFFDADFPFGKKFTPTLSEPLWLIPSMRLPEDVHPQQSNNNVSISIFKNRLYVAFRTGPTHFASKKTGMYIISTADGRAWRKEMEFFLGRDFREPHLVPVDGRLHFYCFAAGQSMTSFEPDFISLYTTDGSGTWQGPQNVLDKGEVHWEMKPRNGELWMTSYSGSHYQVRGDVKVNLHLKHGTDGIDWTALGDSGRVYQGGVSETAFEFDRHGDLWAITRNEDGDKTGFGSHLVLACAGSSGNWEFPLETDRRCFQSPKMFRHGDELYLIARYQLGDHPFGRASRRRSMAWQRIVNWVGFSLSPKTTALYRIDRHKRKVVHVMDLPGSGDTAFPSIIRLNRDRFLIANYTSPPQRAYRNWLNGQLGRTGIYLQVVEFRPAN